MDEVLIRKKLEFLAQHLESLKEYNLISIDELRDKPKDLKYVEKIIQELVDCAIDINEFILEGVVGEKPWSGKQSFRNLEHRILQKENLELGEEDLKTLIDLVSFRNEIVHSYDVNVYLIWSKRSIKTIVDLYKKYSEKIITLLEKID